MFPLKKWLQKLEHVADEQVPQQERLSISSCCHLLNCLVGFSGLQKSQVEEGHCNHNQAGISPDCRDGVN